MATRPNGPIDIGNCRKIRLKTNKQGTYEVWWTDARGYVTRRESCRTKERAEAEAYLHEFCEVAAAQVQRVSHGQLTIEQLCQLWLAHAERHSKTRSGDYVLRAVRARLGRCTVTELTERRLEDYHDSRGASGVGDSTVRRELGALQTVLIWAAKRKHIERGDIPEFELPKAGEPRDRFLTRAQEAWFWDQAMAWSQGGGGAAHQRAARYRVTLFVALALATAARRAAICELTWDRVDLDRRRIEYKVPGQVSNELKKRPTVPIADRLLPVLIEAAGRAPKDWDGQPVGRVIGAGARVHSLGNAFRTFATTIGMPWVTPHVLRHTWGTLAAQNAVPLWDIAGMMGDTVKTATDNYLHHTPEHLMRAANHLTNSVSQATLGGPTP